MRAGIERWPALPLASWTNTYATIHMWMQVIGKVRLALAPQENHWWHVPLYVWSRGLTTSVMPYRGEALELAFDFVAHELIASTTTGERRALPLTPRTVADFYAAALRMLADLGVEVRIWPMPVEVPDPIRFDRDTMHGAYDPEYANRWWRVLVAADAVFKTFRGRFIGKCSPVHLFWGSLDLAVTRFSGRRAPARPGADRVTELAYSHEVISAGFWPGGGAADDAAFYAYAAPEPAGFADAPVRPRQASYNRDLGEFLLPYAAMRSSPDPDAALMDFLESTYEAGATLGAWPRTELEPDRSGGRAHV